MAFEIQRIPQGLLNLLSLKGGLTPRLMAEQVVPSLELLQFYGLQQRQVLTASAVIAEAASISIGGGGAANAAFTSQWCVLFGLSIAVVKTTTMTACSVTGTVSRQGSTPQAVCAENLTPFGATEGGTVFVPWFAPYPLLLPPPWNVAALLSILGTDATANVAINAEIGVLG